MSQSEMALNVNITRPGHDCMQKYCRQDFLAAISPGQKIATARTHCLFPRGQAGPSDGIGIFGRIRLKQFAESLAG